MRTYLLEIRHNFKSFLWWTIILVALVFGFMSIYPSMYQGAFDMTQMKLDALPPEMLEAFGLNKLRDFTDPSIYLGYIAQYMNLALAAYVAILGGFSLAREENDGTIEFLFAQPVTRSQIVSKKLLANLTLAKLIFIIYSVSLISGVLIFQPKGYQIMDHWSRYAGLILGAGFVMIVFYSLSFMLSAIMRNTSATIGISLGTIFASYIVGIVGELNKDFNWLSYFSPIGLIAPSKTFFDAIEWLPITAWLVFSALCIFLTYVIYRRKDFKN